MKTAAALARRGEEVTLILPRGKRDPALSAEDVRRWFGVVGDFRILQIPSRWAGVHLASTCLWLLQIFDSGVLGSADLFHSRAPVMIAAGQVCPIPFATEQYRLWPDEWPFLRPHIRRTARHPRCLGYILHSDHAARSYRDVGVPEAKLLVAHNGADPAAVEPGARARLGLPRDRTLAVYAGRINERKGLDQILALAALRPETLFLLVGSEGEGWIEREARGHPNVEIVPWQAPERLPLYLAAADVLLIPPSVEPLERYRTSVLPMKTFAYLAAGRPILAPRSPDLAGLLADGSNALLVPPGDPEAAAAALDRLTGDAGLARRLGEEAARTAQGLSWDARADRIAAFLRRRLAEARPSA